MSHTFCPGTPSSFLWQAGRTLWPLPCPPRLSVRPRRCWCAHYRCRCFGGRGRRCRSWPGRVCRRAPSEGWAAQGGRGTGRTRYLYSPWPRTRSYFQKLWCYWKDWIFFSCLMWFWPISHLKTKKLGKHLFCFTISRPPYRSGNNLSKEELSY